MTIDYTRPIRAYANWDETLSWPARVVGERRVGSRYEVAIDAEHVVCMNGQDWPSGEVWTFTADGKFSNIDDVRRIHLRNVEEKPKELVAWDDVPQWAKDRVKHFAQRHATNPTNLINTLNDHLARYITTYEKPEPDRALIVAREVVADISTADPNCEYRRKLTAGKLDHTGRVQAALAGYNRGLKDAPANCWIEYTPGDVRQCKEQDWIVVWYRDASDPVMLKQVNANWSQRFKYFPIKGLKDAQG